jgi:FeS assembly SUF system regulator
MFRLNKLADYALVVMQYVASHPDERLYTARSLAKATHLPVPTVVKVLKGLLDHDLLVSHRGVKGGYAPARSATQISVAEIIEAIEGPMGFTECAIAPGRCDLEGRCRIEANTRIIGQMMQQTLKSISLSDLTALLSVAARAPNRRSLITSITLRPGGVQ